MALSPLNSLMTACGTSVWGGGRCLLAVDQTTLEVKASGSRAVPPAQLTRHLIPSEFAR